MAIEHYPKKKYLWFKFRTGEHRDGSPFIKMLSIEFILNDLGTAMQCDVMNHFILSLWQVENL